MPAERARTKDREVLGEMDGAKEMEGIDMALTETDMEEAAEMTGLSEI